MATMSLATTATYSSSAKYDLISFTPIPPTSSRSDGGRRTRNGSVLATPDKSKRCFSMSIHPTASITKSKPTSALPEQKSHRTITFLSPVPSPQRRQRTTYGQNLPSLPLLKANNTRTTKGHKKTHSIQFEKLADTISSPLVQSPLQQTHGIDWTVDAQAREIETEPESSSCATCEDYVYMAPCEHHPSKGQTEYLINDIFPKLTVSVVIKSTMVGVGTLLSPSLVALLFLDTIRYKIRLCGINRRVEHTEWGTNLYRGQK